MYCVNVSFFVDMIYMSNILIEYIIFWSNTMQVKERAKQVIDKLPDESTMDEIIHALYINTKFQHGVDEIKKGEGIPHEEAVEKLRKWQK